MAIGPATRKNLIRILSFGVLWIFLGLLYTIVEFGIIGASGLYPSTGIAYNFRANVITTPLVSFLGGTMVMVIDTWVIERRLKRKSFRNKLLIKSLSFILIILATVSLSALILNSLIAEKPIYDVEVINNVGSFIYSFAFWSIILYVSFMTVLCLFIVEMADSLGSNVFWNFFTGRYQTSKVEEKIFMFLDLKNSTSIAEELGHTDYYNFLNYFFEDISRAALKHWGTIYQYVGDEIVIHWPNHKSLESIECFFAIKEIINMNSKVYQEKFGFVPGFRAGIHGGLVAIGEIGTTKKDILYIGDVLNATSRIQGMCKEFGADVLISEDIYSVIDADFSDYTFKDMGCTELRGKKKRVNLYAVAKTNF